MLFPAIKPALLLICLIIWGCSESPNSNQNQNQNQESASKKTNSAENRELEIIFSRQDFKFSVDHCKILINDFTVSPSSTMEELNTIFKKPPEKSGANYFWSPPGIYATLKGPNIESLSFDLNSISDHPLESPFTSVWAFNGVPMDTSYSMTKLIGNSTFKLADFAPNNHGYTYISHCEDYSLVVSLGAQGVWNYSNNAGHLNFKTGLNENNDSPFHTILVWFEGEELK